MAVELRCPDCRAKLRLAEDPEPGSDVECPECNAVFPAPDPDTGEVPDERGGKKKKQKKGDAAKKKAAAPKDNSPKKRKAKKKEPNRTAMTLIIVGAVAFLSLVVGLLIWYFNRKPASYEMMTYLPEDATAAVGLNIGHIHKYAEFKKTVEPTYANQGFQQAINALAKAFGIEPDAVPDYMVQGWGKNGGSLVIRTKKEFDQEDISKLPGAQKGVLGGETYYSIPAFPKLFGGAPLKVFAPTKRIIVFAEYNLPQATFQNMMSGNKDGDTINKRLGALGKRTTRGTFWNISVLDTTNRPKEVDKKELDSGKGAFQAMTASTAAKGKGMGFKASLGSRAIRFEVVLWFEGDSDTPSEISRKTRDSDLTKAQDDSSLDPPKWWKDFGDTFIGSRKVVNELFTNLGYKSSGDLFVVSSECETKNVMEVLPALVQKMTGQNSNQMMMPGGVGGAPGGVGGAPPGGGAPPPGLPGGIAPPGGP